MPREHRVRRLPGPALAGALALIVILLATPRAGASLVQVNLVTDDQAVNSAKITDPALVNAWGISRSGGSPFWVSDNGTGVSTLYSVTPDTNIPTKIGLTVTIPGAGNVTGQVNTAGVPAGSFNGNAFLFVSEDGTVSGWRGALGTTAEILQTPSADNSYKGSALDITGGHAYLLAANFHSGAIDVLKGDGGAPSLAGNFTDPGLPNGFAPFNIQRLGNTIYVTYAKIGAGGDDEAGPGNGFVSAFDLNGNFLARVGSQGTLNSPWGLAIAPAGFPFAGDLLVGNFGDGRINAFNLGTNTFDGQLEFSPGHTVQIDGLWGLIVGNNASAGSSAKLYFSAGPDDESHGLFGALQAVPEPSTIALALTGGLAVFGFWRRRRES